MKVLFVAWDGPQVSYLEGLFLPIFKRLAKHGLLIHILQFTWGGRQKVANTQAACEAAGIAYRSVEVWRRPVSAGSLLTALRGRRDISRAIRDWEIDVIMPRSTLPALASLLALRGTKIPLVFDADGLPLDERVEFGGQSPSSLVYRFLRDIEAQAVRRADVVLTRTGKAMDILLARAGAGTPKERLHQVGNGRDANRFALLDADSRARVRQRLGIDSDAPLVVYAGSLGDQYCLPQMLALFTRIHQRRPDTRFLILTGSPDLARSEVAQYAELENKIVIHSVPPGDVPDYLASADLGLALRKATFSMQGVAPIKLGEYLLCGLPVVATLGVGDTSSISPDVGYLVNQHDPDTLNEVAGWFTDTVLSEREPFRARCRKVGLEHYSLESSVASYLQALESLKE